MSRGHIADDRQLIHHALMKFRYREFFRSASDQSGSLLRHNCRDEAGLLQQFDPHPVAGIEFLPFITRFGIVHAGIGENSVHIRGEEAEFPQEASRGFLLSLQFHALMTRRAGRPDKNRLLS